MQIVLEVPSEGRMIAEMIRKLGKNIGDFLNNIDDDLYIGGATILVIILFCIVVTLNVFF